MIAAPNTTNTIPVARFNTSGAALFAKTAAILAHNSVNITHKNRISISGAPPIANEIQNL